MNTPNKGARYVKAATGRQVEVQGVDDVGRVLVASVEDNGALSRLRMVTETFRETRTNPKTGLLWKTGYLPVEESSTSALFREAPMGSTWDSAPDALHATGDGPDPRELEDEALANAILAYDTQLAVLKGLLTDAKEELNRRREFHPGATVIGNAVFVVTFPHRVSEELTKGVLSPKRFKSLHVRKFDTAAAREHLKKEGLLEQCLEPLSPKVEVHLVSPKLAERARRDEEKARLAAEAAEAAAITSDRVDQVFSTHTVARQK